MAKKFDVYEMITNRIIEKLEQGVIPWKKPWKGGEENLPKNLISNNHYNGINIMLLGMQRYDSPYWLTYKQAQNLGGSVNKGERGTPIVYYNMIDKKTENKTTGDMEIKTIPFLRYFTVFNLEQVTLPEDKIPVIEKPSEEKKFVPIEKAEKIWKNYKNSPELRHNEQRAFYRVSEDIINMPKKETFHSSEGYFATLFHEGIHSTGATHRLNRDTLTKNTRFGNEVYSKEELIAEFGASYLCGIIGIENEIIDNSASYIQSWIAKFKEDKKILISACGKAQKAVDYILGKTSVK